MLLSDKVYTITSVMMSPYKPTSIHMTCTPMCLRVSWQNLRFVDAMF